MIDLSVNLPGLKLKNPIIPASGTFGYGEEFESIFDLNILGSIMVKGTTLNKKLGNSTPRVAEVYGGMLNAIGLQNPGSEAVVGKKLKFLSKFDFPVIVNIAGSSIEEYEEVARIISREKNVGALEVNISCPNVKEGGITFGTDEKLVKEVAYRVKLASACPVYIKLSPNVSDIVKMAKAARDGGADGISMINTLLGMRLDLKSGKPILANKTGGFSGPAIKPVAIRMIYDVYKSVQIPIIGMGGVSSAEDVLEFLYAGSSAVAIGTMNLVNPLICKEIIERLPSVLEKYGFNSVLEAVGFSHR